MAENDKVTHRKTSTDGDDACDVLVEESSDVIKPLDGAWGWMVVFGLMIHMYSASGIVRSFTLLYLAMLDRYNQSDTLTSLTIAITLSTYFAFSFVTGMLSNRYPARTLALIGSCSSVCGLVITAFAPSIYVVYLGIGFFHGLGMALGISPGTIILNKYFRKKKSLAFGFVNTAKGISAFTIPALVAFMLQYYGWSGTLLIQAGVALHTLIGSLLFRPLENNYPSYLRNKRSIEVEDTLQDNIKYASSEPQLDTLMISRSMSNLAKKSNDVTHQNGLQKNDGDTVTDKKQTCFQFDLLKHYKFMCFAFGLGLFNFGVNSMAFLAPLGKELGFSSNQITLSVTIFGVSDLVGALFLGYIFDVKFVRKKRYHLFYILFFINGVVSAFIGLFRGFIPFMICVIAKGLVANVFWMRVPILADIVGDAKVASGIAIMSPIFGIGNLAGPIIGGLLKDEFNSYAYVMHFAGATTVLASLILCLGIFDPTMSRKHKSDHEDHNEQIA